MTFRIEEKIFINKKNLINFYIFLKKNSAKKIFDTRVVESVYFDNEFLKMHTDGEEGLVPRKKIRIRNYNNKEKYYLEKKISSAEGRFKTSKLIADHKKYIRHGIFDNMYGMCKPKIKISYLRSYFQLFNFRITIDNKIIYKKFYKKKRSKIYNLDDEIVVEIKTNDLKKFNDLNILFPFQRRRFSKYSRGILRTFC